MLVVNLFYVSVVSTYWFDTCYGNHTISKKVNLPLYKEITIESPGYPRRNYDRDTTYTWMVTAPELAEEINISIEMDVHETPGFPCDDFLQIQEMKDSSFEFFKQCGKRTTNRVARDNKLMITLYSNDDRFTAKGFRLRLKVLKISTRRTIKTTLATTTSLMSKTSNTPMTKTTTSTSTKSLFPHKFKTTIKTIFSKILSTKISPMTKVMTRKTTETTTQPTTIVTEVTTRKSIETTLLNRTTAQPTTSTEIMSSIPAIWDSSLPTLPLTTEFVGTSNMSRVDLTTDLQHTTNSEIPNSSSTTLNAVTSTETTTFVLNREMDTQHTINSEIPNSSRTTINAVSSTKPTTSALGREMVILMVGIGVVEVTIIIVGILAVKRFRQNKSKTTRRSKENVGRPVSRKTVCSIDNVYATIPEEEFEENPYKDLSEGVYDTTSKRRSHVNGSRNEYSRGSFYSRLFRSSKISGRSSIQEMHPMFSTFRDTKKETK